MKPFRFCPACGADLDQPDGEGGAHCPNCDRKWYRNMAPTAGVAILRDDRVLVTVRAMEPERGRFDVPGGFLRVGEDPVAGLRREVREELGWDIEVDEGDLLQAVPHAYGSEDEWVLAMGFVARAPEGEPVPADDVAEVRWVTGSELDELDFAWTHDRDLIRKAFDHARS